MFLNSGYLEIVKFCNTLCDDYVWIIRFFDFCVFIKKRIVRIIDVL